MVAALDDGEHARARDFRCELLRAFDRGQPVLRPRDDIDRAGDVPGDALQRETQRDLAGLFQIRALRAHAKGLDVHFRTPREARGALVGAGERDTRPDAPVEGRRARSVVAPERDAPDADAARVEVRARPDEIDDGLHRLLVLGANGEVVLALPLPRAVEGKRREPALEEALLVVAHFLLGRVEPHAHDDDRGGRSAARLAQVRVEMPALIGDRHALAGWIEERQRLVAAVDGLAVRLLHLLEVVHEQELPEVVAQRRARVVLPGGELEALLQRLVAERFVDRRARAPRLAPVLPAAAARGHLLEVGERHPVRDEARRPVRDRGLDPRVLPCGSWRIHRRAATAA